MSSYADILTRADSARATHHQRMAELTSAHFQRHPECAYRIIGMSADATPIRSKTETIDVAKRCEPRWYDACGVKPTIEQRRDDERPIAEGHLSVAGRTRSPRAWLPQYVTDLRQARLRGDLSEYDLRPPSRRTARPTSRANPHP